MIPSIIRQTTLQKDYEKLGLYKFEYDYIQLLTEIIEQIGKKKKLFSKLVLLKTQKYIKMLSKSKNFLKEMT